MKLMTHTATSHQKSRPATTKAPIPLIKRGGLKTLGSQLSMPAANVRFDTVPKSLFERQIAMLSAVQMRPMALVTNGIAAWSASLNLSRAAIPASDPTAAMPNNVQSASLGLSLVNDVCQSRLR